MSGETETVIFSVVEYLQLIKEEHPAESRDALDTAISSLRESFGIDSEDPKQIRKLSLKPHTLTNIFEAGVSALGAKSYTQELADAEATEGFAQFVKVVTSKGYFKGVEEGSPEYDERMSKLIAKFKARTAAASPGTTGEEAGAAKQPAPARASPEADSTARESKPAKEREAEEIKAKGNKLLNAKDYEGAEKCYTQALELSPNGPNSHVYLCNRAAALCYLGRNDDAVVDCQESIDLKPDYAKAYTRLGYAYFQLEDFEASVKAYKKSLELDPANAANVKSLKKALAKAGMDPSSGELASGDGSRAMPDLSALASMMGGGAGGGGSSGGGLASMMSAMVAAGNNSGASSGAGNSSSDGGNPMASMMAAMAGAGAGAGGSTGSNQGGGLDLNAGDSGEQGGLASMISALAGGGDNGGNASSAGDSSGAGSQAGLASMMSALAGAGGGASGGSGGNGGLAGLLNNPGMMQQVQALMSNPAMMQQVQSMMSNPAMMQSIMGMMGAREGGMGDQGAGSKRFPGDGDTKRT